MATWQAVLYSAMTREVEVWYKEGTTRDSRERDKRKQWLINRSRVTFEPIQNAHARGVPESWKSSSESDSRWPHKRHGQVCSTGGAHNSRWRLQCQINRELIDQIYIRLLSCTQSTGGYVPSLTRLAIGRVEHYFTLLLKESCDCSEI